MLSPSSPPPAVTVTFEPSRLIRYGSAIGSVLVATLTRFALAPVLGMFNTPYLTYFVAVVVSAWVGGAGPGALSVLLGAALAAYYFMPPAYSFHLIKSSDGWSLLVFVLSGLCITALGEGQRRSKRRAEESLRETRLKEQQLATTMHSIGDAVIVTDAQGRITLMNAVACALTGWTEEAARGQKCEDVFRISNEQTGQTVDSPVRKVQESGATVGLANHTVLTAKDGTRHPIDDSGAPIRDAANNISGVVLVFRDVAARREDERRLEASEERHRLAMEAGKVGTWDWDIRKNQITWSDRIYEIHGVDKDTFGGTVADFAPLIHPEEQERVQAAIQKSLSERLPYQIEFRIVRPDGEVRWIATSGRVYADENNQPYRMLGATTDVTETRREERIQSFLLLLDERVRPLIDPEKVLSETVCALGEHLGVARCTFADIDTAKDTAVVRSDYCNGVPSHAGIYTFSAFGRQRTDDLKAGKTILIENTKTDPRTADAYESRFAPLEVRAVLTVPLLQEGILRAILNVHSIEPRQWTAEEAELMEKVMERTWLTVENARLYRRAQDELADRITAEERLRSILDNTPSIIYVKDLEGRYLLVNHAFETLNGRSFEEMRGRTDLEMFPPHLAEAIVANDRLVLETGKPQQFEENGPYEDRALTYISTKFPLRDAAGAIYGLCGVSTDITERKQIEIERQFLTDASEVLASSLDYEQTLQRVATLAVPHIGDWCAVDMLEENDEIVLLGVGHIDPEKVQLAHDLRKIYPPRMGEPGLPNVLRTGKAEIYSDITDEMLVAGARDPEHLQIMRDIGFRSVMLVPIVSRDRVLGAITFVTTGTSGHLYNEKDQELAEGLAARAALAIDNARLYRAAQQELEERRRVQDALRVSEERFRFALAQSGITVYMMDADLRYPWSYDGNSEGELAHIKGKADADFLEPEDAAALTEIKRRVLRTGIEERHIARATRLGQEPKFYDTLFAPLRDAEGSIVGVTGTVHDVTERKQAQDELASHQAEIEMLNVQLQRSMRETHHRVKNNLQVITALVNMQQMQYDDQVPVSELQRLTQHIRALASIHDLLTRQAQTDAEVSDLSVREVMEKLMPTVQGMVEGRTISFEVEDIRLPVRQSSTFAVLVNELISNALKHGEGAIHVQFRVEEGTARLAVMDEGQGFPEDFDPARAANTGLDLIGSLSRMDMRGGVRYTNRPEGGACVVIEFPVPKLTKTPGEE